MPTGNDPRDTQPKRNKPQDDHREYIPATWAAAGGGSGHPKIAGGITVDKKTGNPAPRAFNRPDQRYSQPQSTIIANRQARATAEYAATVILVGAEGRFEVRTQTGNNYDISPDVLFCDCPDWLRMEESGYGIVKCKHIYMVEAAKVDGSLPEGIPYSTDKVAEMVGAERRTIENLCQQGEIVATKVHNVWVIQPSDADAFQLAYLAGVWPW